MPDAPMCMVPTPPISHETAPDSTQDTRVTLSSGFIPDNAMIVPSTSSPIELLIRCAQSAWRKGWKTIPVRPSVLSGSTPRSSIPGGPTMDWRTWSPASTTHISATNTHRVTTAGHRPVRRAGVPAVTPPGPAARGFGVTVFSSLPGQGGTQGVLHEGQPAVHVEMRWPGVVLGHLLRNGLRGPVLRGVRLEQHGAQPEPHVVEAVQPRLPLLRRQRDRSPARREGPQHHGR